MRFPLLRVIPAVCVLVPVLAGDPVYAQAFGIGARLAMINADVEDDVDSERFTGGQIRLGLSGRTALEVSFDTHSVTDETTNQRIRDFPIQASLLVYPVRTVFSPYLLGGPGWYSHRVSALEGDDDDEAVTTREFGWHAGFGAELKLGRHAGIHADYRYTFLDFGDDDEEAEGAADAEASSDDSFLGGLWPSHGGSMWTAGVTFYF